MPTTLGPREEFIENNLGLVHACAGRFRGRGVEYDDLYSAGCMGLIKAYDGFDQERGVQFSTYAVPVILGEIKKLFRDGGTVKVSRSLKELGLRVSAARERMIKQNGCEPSVSPVSYTHLTQALKLLHPFMPFITEEIYRALPGTSETIMTEQWPVFCEELNYAAEEADFEKLMDYIKAVRTIRAEMNVHPAKRSSMIIETSETEAFRRGGDYLAKFAFATDVILTEKYTGDTAGMVQVITHAARGFIPMMELIDREKELARLNKEKAGAEKEIGMFSRQLSNEGFVNKAPANVVEEIRQKLARAQEKLARVEESIAALG